MIIENIIQAFKDQRDVAFRRQEQIWNQSAIMGSLLPRSIDSKNMDPILDWIKFEIKSNSKFKEQLEKLLKDST